MADVDAAVALYSLDLDDEGRKVLDSMSSDLKYLLSEQEVPDGLIRQIGTLGYKSIATFGVLADDRASAPRAFETDFRLVANTPGLALDVSTKARVLATRLIAAWVTASTRAVEESRASAEHRALRLPMLLPKSSMVALRAR